MVTKRNSCPPLVRQTVSQHLGDRVKLQVSYKSRNIGVIMLTGKALVVCSVSVEGRVNGGALQRIIDQ